MPAGAVTKKVLVALSVKLEVVTNDKLRKFVFGLKKSKENDLDKWSIDFELLDRSSTAAEFSRVIFLDVDLDLKKVDVLDIETTADKGFNKPQVEFVLTSVAADAEKLNANKIKEPRMKRTVSDVFAARNA